MHAATLRMIRPLALFSWHRFTALSVSQIGCICVKTGVHTFAPELHKSAGFFMASVKSPFSQLFESNNSIVGFLKQAMSGPVLFKVATVLNLQLRK